MYKRPFAHAMLVPCDTAQRWESVEDNKIGLLVETPAFGGTQCRKSYQKLFPNIFVSMEQAKESELEFKNMISDQEFREMEQMMPDKWELNSKVLMYASISMKPAEKEELTQEIIVDGNPPCWMLEDTCRRTIDSGDLSDLLAICSLTSVLLSHSMAINIDVHSTDHMISSLLAYKFPSIICRDNKASSINSSRLPRMTGIDLSKIGAPIAHTFHVCVSAFGICIMAAVLWLYALLKLHQFIPGLQNCTQTLANLIQIPYCRRSTLQARNFWWWRRVFCLVVMPCSKMGINEAPVVEGFFWRGRNQLGSKETLENKSSKSWDACALCSKNSAWPMFTDLNAPVCSNETGSTKLSPFTGAERFRLNNRMCDPCKNCESCAGCDIDAEIVKAGGSSQHLFLRTTDFAGVQHLALVGNKQVRKRWWQPIQNAEPVRLLSSYCGLDDIVATERVGSLRSVVLQKGRYVQISGENVIFSEIVKTSEKAKKGCKFLNGPEVVKAALFDFLLGMCDRTVSNIIINEDGKLKLIDNTDSAFNVYGYNWRALGCFAGVRSIFIRTFAYAQRFEWPSPPHSCYDYRCHATGGKIDKNYPEAFKGCIQSLSEQNVSSIFSKYKLPSMQSAERLRERARWLKSGFETAVFQNYQKYGNMKSKNVEFQPRVFQPQC